MKLTKDEQKIKDKFPLFNPDDNVFVGGRFFTKREVLKNQEDAEKCDYYEKEYIPLLEKQYDEKKEIVERLKKRIEEFSNYKLGKGICIEVDPNKKYEVIDISVHILLELQKILEGKK